MNFKTLIAVVLVATTFLTTSVFAYQSGRESDGERNSWKIGDPYHPLHLELMINNEIENFSIERTFIRDQVPSEINPPYRRLSVCKKKSSVIKTVDFYVTSSILKNQYYGVIIDGSKTELFLLNRSDSCLKPVGTMPTDELVQQATNEARMLVDRLQLYFEGYNFFVDSIQSAGGINQWNDLYDDFKSFFSSVYDDMGNVYQLPKDRTSIERFITLVHLRPSVFREAYELINETLSDFDLTLFQDKSSIDYIDSIALAKMVALEKFELNKIKNLLRAIKRYPSEHPRSLALTQELNSLLEQNGYQNLYWAKILLGLEPQAEE